MTEADIGPSSKTTTEPLGPLTQLAGTWKGHGFNTIWRPHHGGEARFLELNLTSETLVFTKINGAIPNRGFRVPDINLFGLTYMQQIAETSTGAGLHLETGMWANVPPTTEPPKPATVVRLGSIAHGAVVLAQGTTQLLVGGPPQIPDSNIVPFPIGSAPAPNGDFATASRAFPELDLSVPTALRSASPGITQAMVQNPNSVLQSAIEQSVNTQTFIHISTREHPVQNGTGTANTAFLAGTPDPRGGNGKAVEVQASYWIETVLGASGRPDVLQLQYSQVVQLDFNGLRWPHCTVATLRKQ